MDIFKNSYVIFVISFIILSVIVYLFGIGQQVELGTTIKDGKNKVTVDEKFNWKYPLGISLLIWAFWHFYLYPVDDNLDFFGEPAKPQFGGNRLQQDYNNIQKIDLHNWY